MPPKSEPQTTPVPKAIRFTADYDYVEPTRTIAFKKGGVHADLPQKVRDAALASGKAVEDGQG